MEDATCSVTIYIAGHRIYSGGACAQRYFFPVLDQRLEHSLMEGSRIYHDEHHGRCTVPASGCYQAT